MLIYIIFLSAVTVFLYRESQKLASSFKESYEDAFMGKVLLRLLRRLCLLSAFSAFLMLLCYVCYKWTGIFLKPLAVISILLYTLGLIICMLKLKKIYRL